MLDELMVHVLEFSFFSCLSLRAVCPLQLVFHSSVPNPWEWIFVHNPLSPMRVQAEKNEMMSQSTDPHRDEG